MKTNYLFPNRFKKVGWLILPPAILITIIEHYKTYLLPGLWADTNPYPGIVNFYRFFDTTVFAIMGNYFDGDNVYFQLIENNIFNEILLVLTLVGSIFIAFSKERHEDELIAKIRTESLVWATYVNYAVLLLSILFIFNSDFLEIIKFNMFTILLFFIVRFNIEVAKLKKSLSHEE